MIFNSLLSLLLLFLIYILGPAGGKSWYEEYWWIMLIIGIIIGIILSVIVVFSLIFFNRKRKHKQNLGEDVYDKPKHKESPYNLAFDKETIF